MSELAYRSFRNADPPQLVGLWKACGLGRGAVTYLSCDAFDMAVLSRPYFDRNGLIVACDGPRVVGFVHAGFGHCGAELALNCQQGVVCALMVHPEFRRQGIATKLLQLASDYLRQRGAEQIYAGPSHGRDPFYCGIYGGSESAGFLESDPSVHAFLEKSGFSTVERHLVFQRRLAESRDPVGLRVMSVRRNTRLVPATTDQPRSWWWNCRYGLMESIELALAPKANSQELARVTVVSLDQYGLDWQDDRPVGFLDIQVSELQRRKGYGQVLLLEAARRLKGELASLLEVHVPESNIAAIQLVKSANFQLVDAGRVYRLA